MEIITDDASVLIAKSRKLVGDFGKFYTPAGLCRLLSRLVASDRRPSRVLDPACGAGSLLLYAWEVIGAAFYAGQEIDAGSCELARRNMIANGVDFFEIVEGDSLAAVGPWSEKFDAVVANPPFSVPWDPAAVPFDPRFQGVLAPRSKADLAFVQHGLFWLNNGGKAAYVLFPGALYRGGAESKVRAQLLPFVRAVVAMPEKLFEETTIATVCVLFEKTPSSAPVYFLDASEFCVKGKKSNELSDEHIGKICAMIAERRVVEYQSAIKEQAVVASNDFNLSPNAYVEVKHESDNPYDGMSIVEVVEDGEAWARYSYYRQMKALAMMRQTFGLPYDPEILDKDVDALKPKSYGTFNRSQ